MPISLKRAEKIANEIDKFGLDKAAEINGITTESAARYKRKFIEKSKVETKQNSVDIDLKNGTGSVTFDSHTEIRTLDELKAKCKIDTELWNIDRYVQNYWGNSKTPHWQVKAWLSARTKAQQIQDSFIDFLRTYKPAPKEANRPKQNYLTPASLIINKQDSHLNKLDVHGNNDVNKRFSNIFEKVDTIIQQASLSNQLENITYVLGSDMMNSEFTGTTTKGTPQQNTHDYHKSFEMICNHEVSMIRNMLECSNTVFVVFVAGNHDEFAGWHIVNWLRVFFRNEQRIVFDTAPAYRKYVSYGNSAVMFNHGDAIKPDKLAAMFPIEYREDWSAHEFFYIFTGDKHHEMAKDYNGIKLYQLPALSSARSNWDEKNGYTCAKAEVTGYLIDYKNGITNTFKQILS